MGYPITFGRRILMVTKKNKPLAIHLLNFLFFVFLLSNIYTLLLVVPFVRFSFFGSLLQSMNKKMKKCTPVFSSPSRNQSQPHFSYRWLKSLCRSFIASLISFSCKCQPILLVLPTVQSREFLISTTVSAKFTPMPQNR